MKTTRLSGRRLGVLLALLGAALVLYWYAAQRLVAVDVLRLPSGHLFLMEVSSHPALQSFKEIERIDPVAEGGNDELSRLLALAQWASGQFRLTTPFPDYPPWNAAETLGRIRRGETGGFCAQYAIVFGQACQSLGFQVRYVDLATAGLDASHFVPEVYLPSRGKWVVFEPQEGRYYGDGSGSPLGVEELHLFLTGRREGTVHRAPSGEPSPEGELALFARYRYYLRNNFLSVPAYYTVRVVDGGLQWIFEQYRPPCPYRFPGDGLPADDFAFSPLFEGAGRGAVLSVKRFLDLACEGPDYVVSRVKAPPEVLDGVVRLMLEQELDFHPLDDDTSWWPVPRSAFPPPQGN